MGGTNWALLAVYRGPKPARVGGKHTGATHPGCSQRSDPEGQELARQGRQGTIQLLTSMFSFSKQFPFTLKLNFSKIAVPRQVARSFPRI